MCALDVAGIAAILISLTGGAFPSTMDHFTTGREKRSSLFLTTCFVEVTLLLHFTVLGGHPGHKTIRLLIRKRSTWLPAT
jgi:hypothetical protein